MDENNNGQDAGVVGQPQPSADVMTGQGGGSPQPPVATPSPTPQVAQPVVPAPLTPEQQRAEWSTKLTSWLQVFYILAIIGAIGTGVVALFTLIPAIISIFAGGVAMTLGGVGPGLRAILLPVVNIAFYVAYGLVLWQIAKRIKNRSTNVFDSYVQMTVLPVALNVATGIISVLAVAITTSSFAVRNMGGPASVGVAIGLLIGGIVWGAAIGFGWLCAWTAYFSKSVQVKMWFGLNPVRHSKYWNLIQKLPRGLWTEPGETPAPAPQPVPAQPVMNGQPMPQPAPVAEPTSPVAPTPPTDQPQV